MTSTTSYAPDPSVQQVLEQATYFVIFSVPDPQSLSQGLPLLPPVPAGVYKINIVEAPRRLQLFADAPTTTCGFRAHKAISLRQIADQTLNMEVSPNNFQSGPGRTPWPTLLLPFFSQRFWMFHGHFAFRDGENTGFRAIAGGRFFPATDESVWIGGVADIVEGLGNLEGFTGNLTINGLTTPPSTFANCFLFRFVDPDGALRADNLPPVDPETPDPDYSDSAVLALAAEPHPDHGLEIETIPGRPEKRFHIVEQLRISQTDFDVRVPGVLKSKVDIGDVVGERRTTLVFDPDFEGGDPPGTIPMYSTNSEFRFFAGGDRPIGTLQLDLREGRAFRTTQPGLDQPYFRIAGFGVPQTGTGQFMNLEGQGMLSLNGAFSYAPYALSSMYLLRLRDPDGRFRPVWQTAAHTP